MGVTFVWGSTARLTVTYNLSYKLLDRNRVNITTELLNFSELRIIHIVKRIATRNILRIIHMRQVRLKFTALAINHITKHLNSSLPVGIRIRI